MQAYEYVLKFYLPYRTTHAFVNPNSVVIELEFDKRKEDIEKRKEKASGKVSK